MSKEVPTLRVALPHFERNVTQFTDPATVTFDNDIQHLQILYSPLIQNDLETGRKVSGLAERFYWEGKTLYLELRKDFRTVDGQEITAEDVIFNFKRVFLRKKSVPGDLKSLLCRSEFKSIDDECPALKAKGKFLFSIEFPIFNSLFLDYLTLPDFYIIPRKSLAKDSLEITEARNTSGPYFVAGKEEDYYILLPNAGHWALRSSSPKKIKVLSDEYNNEKIPKSIKWFLENKVDHVPVRALGGTKLSLHEKIPESDFYISDENTVMYAFFTEKGVKKFSPELRRIMGSNFRKAIEKQRHLLSKHRKPKTQLFVDFAFGSLSQAQLSKIQSFDASTEFKWQGPKVTIGCLDHALDYYKRYLSPLQEHIVWEPISDLITENFRPDTRTDIGGVPDIIIAGYTFEQYENVYAVEEALKDGHFALRGNEISEWLAKYKNTTSAKDREAMIRNLHFKTVFEDPHVIPLISFPMDAVSRNGWKMDFPRNRLLGPLWLLKYDPN